MDYTGIISLIISTILIFSIFAYIGKQGKANDKPNEFFPHKLIYAITWLNFPIALGLLSYVLIVESKLQFEGLLFVLFCVLIWLIIASLSLYKLYNTSIRLEQNLLVYRKGCRVKKIYYKDIENAFTSCGILYLTKKERNKKGVVLHFLLPGIFHNLSGLVSAINSRSVNAEKDGDIESNHVD